MTSRVDALRQVRLRTSAPLADCVEALGRAEGDVERAVEDVRARQVRALGERTGASPGACEDALGRADGDVERAAALLLRADQAGAPVAGYVQTLLAGAPAPAAARAIYAYLQSLDEGARTPAEQAVFLVMDLATQIGGDGLDSFFGRAPSQAALEATEQALRELGLEETGAIFRKAVKIARDVDPDGWLAAMGLLDQRFYRSGELVEELVAQYAAAHAAEFS